MLQNICPEDARRREEETQMLYVCVCRKWRCRRKLAGGKKEDKQQKNKVVNVIETGSCVFPFWDGARERRMFLAEEARWWRSAEFAGVYFACLCVVLLVVCKWTLRRGVPRDLPARHLLHALSANIQHLLNLRFLYYCRKYSWRFSASSLLSKQGCYTGECKEISQFQVPKVLKALKILISVILMLYEAHINTLLLQKKTG